MRYLKCIFLAIVALAIAPRANACGPWCFSPYEYYMFRTFDKNSVSWNDTKGRNSLLWQAQTSSSISVKDIEKVVYEYTDAQTYSLLTDKSDKNTFAAWLRSNQDREAVDFLVLAKRCERARAEKNSPWYYPVENDPVIEKIKGVREKALAYDGTRFASRYALQAIRAMYSLNDFEGIIRYWESKCVDMPSDVIKDMMYPYVAGAYYTFSVCEGDGLEASEKASAGIAAGNIDPAYAREMAHKYYAQAQWPEYIDMMQLEGPGNDPLAALSLMAEKCPEAPFVPELLQKIVGGAEPDCLNYDYRSRMGGVSYPGDYLLTMRDICCKMACGYAGANLAAWAYSAAFLQDLLGDVQGASATLEIAQKASGENALIDESVKVMRIYLDTKLGKYNDNDKELLTALKWFENKMRSNLTDEIEEETIYGWQLSSNFSYYYWNDMMRRIVIGELCPRMIDNDRQVKALQLANMADNLMFNIVGKHNYYDKKWKSHFVPLATYRKKCGFNSFDFSNEFFNIMDTLNVGYAVAYYNDIKNCDDELGIYLNERSYCSKDYICEHIGTMYLRDLDYDKALYWLSQVKSSYFATTNIVPYTFRDPFTWDPDTYEGKPRKNYKLDFAKKMVALASLMESDDADVRGKAFVHYGLGMKNSYSLCWALTQYHKFYGEEWTWCAHTEDVLGQAEEFIATGLNTVQDRELAAQCHLLVKDYYTAQFVYGDTPTGHDLLVKCDNLRYWNGGKKQRY